jgi:hypothetical protein
MPPEKGPDLIIDQGDLLQVCWVKVQFIHCAGFSWLLLSKNIAVITN